MTSTLPSVGVEPLGAPSPEAVVLAALLGAAAIVGIMAWLNSRTFRPAGEDPEAAPYEQFSKACRFCGAVPMGGSTGLGQHYHNAHGVGFVKATRMARDQYAGRPSR